MSTLPPAAAAAPDWYRWALEQPCDSGRVVVKDAAVEWVAWGARGDPGVLFVTGNGAHVGWWRHIAPFLADGRRVAALSWTGMGRSDWRERYSPAVFVEEAMAVAETAGLFDASAPPTMIGHSFGGLLTLLAAATVGQRLQRAVLVDARLSTRSVWGRNAPWVDGRRLSPTREAATARFRLKPPQDERNPFILDRLAQEAVTEVAGGWTWRADPNNRAKTDLGPDQSGSLGRARCPLMFVRGQHSTTVTDEVWAQHQATAPAGSPFVEIPDAHHHVMLDQPLAFVAVLRALLIWPAARTT